MEYIRNDLVTEEYLNFMKRLLSPKTVWAPLVVD